MEEENDLFSLCIKDGTLKIGDSTKNRYVNFDGTVPNPVGINQPACNNCGNCCGGCNTGAKNTLNMNYLPDAKAHGAQIFTEIEVGAVTRDPLLSVWRVHYKRNIPVGKFKEEEQFVRAKYVIVGAGALGSTKILLQSKERGLDVSEKLGKGFTGNGDVLGFSYNSKDKMNAVGLHTGLYEKVRTSDPGPAITSVIDLRTLPEQSVSEGFIVEDGTPPGSIKVPYSVMLAIASKVLAVRNFPSQQEMEKLFKDLKEDKMERTLSFLCMSHDDAGGVIDLDSETGGIFIKWDKVGKQQNFIRVNDKLEEITRKLEGTYVINPMWSKTLGRELITVHPLGGCRMGENGSLGVVNHKGQVFYGDSKDVHDGLYVIDGSILPCSVGVNPTLTISVVAERCVRLLVKDAGWKIDYEHFKTLDETDFSKLKPGIRFTERMVGEVTFNKQLEADHCEFTLTIESEDVEEMIEKDPKHGASIAGTVTCKGLSEDPMTVSSGKFQLFPESTEIIDAREMIYDMVLTSKEGKIYYFYGKKIIKDDEFFETGLEDTTTLFTKIYEGSNSNGLLLAKGVLKIKFFDFMKQLNTVEIINTDSTMEKLKWQAKFGNFFMKELWDTYSFLSPSYKFDPDAPPRKKRELNIKIMPKNYRCVTEDKVELHLTRYEGGGKGPLLVCHGMAVSSDYYVMDTIEVNTVEFFVARQYDVWLVDWRVSIKLPAASSLQDNLDDVASYDFPAVVDKVLEVTGQQNVQILVHCASSLGFFSSLLAGKLDGKIRNVVASGVGATPIGYFFNDLKARTHLTGFLGEEFHINSATTYTDIHTTFMGRILNWFAKGVDDLVIASNQRCSSDVCHRISFLYGLLYEHENLNVMTHDVLHEYFGSGTSGFFSHISEVMRKHRLVSAQGKDIYIPFANKEDRLKKEDYLRHVAHLDIPITLVTGTENNCFHPDNLNTFYKLLKEAHPNQSYNLIYIPGYGHIDVFIGKNAHRDVWPKLVAEFDKHAENDAANDEGLLSLVHEALDKVRLVSRQIREQLNTGDGKVDETLLDEVDAAKITSRNFVNTQIFRSISMGDAPPEKEDKEKKILEKKLPLEQERVWYRKDGTKNMFHKEPVYNSPEGDDIEEVVVQRFTIPEDTSKREIYVLSDLHMGGEWSLEIRPRLEDFLRTLAKTAEHYVHSIILLGDIFEMWLTPIAVTPPSMKDFLVQWRSDEAIQVLVSIIRKMLEEDGVNVFYVRGNHDHEIDEKTVKILFGEQIRFVAGKLIYVIDNGVQEYRIRFEHGHDYDLFNSFRVTPLCDHPVGYYVTRLVASTQKNYFSHTEEVIQNILEWFLGHLSDEPVGSTIVDILASNCVQKKFSQTMLEHAYDNTITGEECILLSDDKNVPLDEILNYCFIDDAIRKYGSSYAFSMLKASLGDFSDFLAECGEDVVVIGHTHLFCLSGNLTGRAGDLYYANSGTWIDLVEHFSYVKIVAPKTNEDGSLEVNYKLNDAYRQVRSDPCSKE